MSHIDQELGHFAVEVCPAERRITIAYDEPVLADAALTVDGIPMMSVDATKPVLGTTFTSIPDHIFTHVLRVNVTLRPKS